MRASSRGGRSSARARATRATLGLALAAALALAALLSLRPEGETPVAAAATAAAPNVLVVVADDLRTSDLEHMPNVRRLLADRGTTFPNFFTTMPTCCPSRATFLRGQYAHNHRVGHGLPPTEESFRRNRLDRSTVATWLQEAGYATWYVGKYLNRYEVRRTPPGWGRFHANFRRSVWSRTLNADGTPMRIERGNIDAFLGRLGSRFIETWNGRRPFFLFQNFNAPHANRNAPPPAPAADLRDFAGAKSPRTPAFNSVRSGMHPRVAQRPRLDREAIRRIDAEHRARLASLQVVDRAVRRFVRVLRQRGELERTYIVFTSDNGYHMGERRRESGKMTPLLTDVRVPLIVRGPGVAERRVRGEPVQNTDLAPTVAQIAGAPVPGFVDGRSIVPLFGEGSGAWRTATLFHGRKLDGRPSLQRYVGVSTADGFHYVEYADGFRELYDLGQDPHQLDNVVGEPRQRSRVAELDERLDALMQCAGAECRAAEDGP